MTGRPLAIEQALAEIGEMDRATLAKRWNELFSHQPPKGCKRALLERAAAYHIQASYEGKAKSPLVKKLVASKAAYNKAKQKPKKHKFELRPGARLVREWHGVQERVDVVEEGFIWRDQTFKSLSAVAKEITGSHWSGPRFFGL